LRFLAVRLFFSLLFNILKPFRAGKYAWILLQMMVRGGIATLGGRQTSDRAFGRLAG
jgi:hypothetical protein